MRYKPQQKEQTRHNIITAAGGCFRANGYSGIGIDGLAKAAGVTSGAFYKHFGSKKEIFAVAVTQGLEELEETIRHFKAEHGEHWWPTFARFYLEEKSRCRGEECCALQTLSPEVERCEESTREVFTAGLRSVAEEVSDRADESKPAAEHTWAKLALLIGGVTLARAVSDPDVADEIVQSISQAASTL